MQTWMITIETDQDVLWVERAVGSVQYLSTLFRAGRLVNERIPGAFLRVIGPEMSGVIAGVTEWHKEGACLIFAGEPLTHLAAAAREAGLNYEGSTPS